MAASENDWRDMNQARYLQGAVFRRIVYRRYSATWDHDHCVFCFDKFMEDDVPDVLHEGYATQGIKRGEVWDAYYWVCPTCFDDFKERLEFTVVDDAKPTA